MLFGFSRFSGTKTLESQTEEGINGSPKSGNLLEKSRSTLLLNTPFRPGERMTRFVRSMKRHCRKAKGASRSSTYDPPANSEERLRICPNILRRAFFAADTFRRRKVFHGKLLPETMGHSNPWRNSEKSILRTSVSIRPSIPSFTAESANGRVTPGSF